MIKYIYYESIDSTNNEAKRLIDAGGIDGPTLIVAGEQKAGRGRQGKSFYSPSKTGLYMTAVLPADCPIAGQVTLTTRVAVAAAEAIEAEYGIVPEIKWVNDIYFSGRKCAGILCEAVNDYDAGKLRFAIIGIGINISTSEWPSDIKDTAGNLIGSPSDKASFGQASGYESLARRITDGLVSVLGPVLMPECHKDDDGMYLKFYRDHSNVIGCEITFTENGTVFEARAIDVDETGGLIVEIPGQGIRTLNSGEISIRKK